MEEMGRPQQCCSSCSEPDTTAHMCPGHRVPAKSPLHKTPPRALHLHLPHLRGKIKEKRGTGEGNCSPFLLQQRALATHTQGGAQTRWGELASSCTPSKNSPRKQSSERRQKHPVTFMDIQSLQSTTRTLQNQHKIEARQPETQQLMPSCAHTPLISCFPPHLARLRPKRSQMC